MLSLLCILIFINQIFGDEPLCINGIDAVICTPFFKKNDSKETSLSEVSWLNESEKLIIFQVSAEIPPEDKEGVYYFIVTLFVFATFASTLMTGAFLAMSIALWGHFKQAWKKFHLNVHSQIFR